MRLQIAREEAKKSLGSGPPHLACTNKAWDEGVKGQCSGNRLTTINQTSKQPPIGMRKNETAVWLCEEGTLREYLRLRLKRVGSGWNSRVPVVVSGRV